jgi:chromosome partitioning protein
VGTILAIANQKGGVGKTTTSINLAASLAQLQRRVLLVDLDPQGNATMGCGVNKQTLAHTLNEAIQQQISVQEILLPTKSAVDILPANRDLTEAEVKLLQIPRSQYRLRQLLSPIQGAYDFIIIDCPPSLSMLTINALVAANGVLIPMQCEYYALEGLTGLLETIEQIAGSLNPHLHIEGILRTMYDGRSCLTNDVSQQLAQHFADKLYKTVIPRNIRLAEAPGFGLPAVLYDKKSAGAQAYLSLAHEMLQRQAMHMTPETPVTESLV